MVSACLFWSHALKTENESEVYDKVIALILYNTEREKWCIGTHSGK